MNLSGKETIKIACTYQDGEIFQHFGQTKLFKIYEVENGAIVHSEVTGTNGVSHCSLGSFLHETGVNVLICGGLGGGASKALLSAGILVYAGNSGSCDEAVDKLLRKELIYNPCANCHDEHHGAGGCHGHHHHEDAEACHDSDHNHFEGGHNDKDSDNAGHNHRCGH